MANWFETKISYHQQQADGKVKKVTDTFLMDALSFTEAEARTIEERAPYMSGEFNVKAAKRTKIAEIFYNDREDADKWYQVKWALVTLDDKPCKKGLPPIEKKVMVYTMVQAEHIEDAIECFHAGMKNTLMDYDILAVSETPILGVYPIKTQQEDGGTE